MTLKRNSILLLLFLVAIFPLCFLGFDFTDLGWHVMSGMQALSRGVNHLSYNPYWGGSDILGSLWIHLVGSHLWAIRSAAILIFSSCFLIILSQYKSSENVLVLFSMALLSAAPMTVGMVFMADYYTLPTLFLTLWAAIWLKVNQSPDNWILTLLLLAVTLMIAFLRLPLVVLFLAPLILCLDKKKHFFVYRWLFLIMGAAFISYMSGFWELIQQGVARNKDTYQSFSSAKAFVSSFTRDSIANILFLIEVFFVSFLFHRITKIGFPKILAGIMILLFALGILHSLELLENIPVISSLGKTGFKRSIIGIQLIMIFYCLYKIHRNKKLIITYLPLLSLPLLLIAGTNTGLLKLNYLILVTFFIFSHFYTERISKVLAIILCLSALARNYVHFYRDGNIGDFSTTRISAGKLMDVFTSESTLKKLDSIESFLKINDLSGKRIVTYPELNSIYYLNDSPIYLDFPGAFLIKKSLLYGSIKRDCENNELNAAIIQDSKYDSSSLLDFIEENCPIQSIQKKGDLSFIIFARSQRIKLSMAPEY